MRKETTGSASLYVRWMLFLGVLLVNSGQILASLPWTPALEVKDPPRPYYPSEGGTICQTIDIRNKVENFNQLENCTVIEGELHILLIDQADSKDYASLQFPKLREITDNLLLYRVYGLTTLRHIFPNLSVIRGQKLFYNYALVAFEVPDLTELGLVGLTHIMRGAVRLEKNPQLCYIETVDWAQIAPGVDNSEHYFSGNKKLIECVNTCPGSCTKNSDGPRCWTAQDCQKMLTCGHCPSDFCNNEGRCCDSNCLGGCSGTTAYDCVACKNVLEISHKCVSHCPPGTYRFLNRRCLLDTECMRMDGYKTITPDQLGSREGECSRNCPHNYMEDKKNSSRCTRCRDRCPKVCSSKLVDSVTAAQELKGCTVINGPLEIQINGGSNIGIELEENLGRIEVVTHFIKIIRSAALLSLSFFKSLKTIRGEVLENNEYALMILDNINLQEMFPENVQRDLDIENGIIFVSFNRKLCLHKIHAFTKAVGLYERQKDDENSISSSTNGDQFACSLHELDLTIPRVSAFNAVLKWENFKMADARELLSYIINYKEAPEKNVSIYQGRDACSDDIWMTKDAKKIDDKEANYSGGLLSSLKPWTQYAVYVETFTISLANKGARSKIKYFRTAPFVPTNPVNLQVQMPKERELHISWEPPTVPNGNVTHYEVYYAKRKLDVKQYDIRDYCTHPLVISTEDIEKAKEKAEEKRKNTTSADGCCQCPKTQEQIQSEERDRQMQIKFENYLHNTVYIKRIDTKRTNLTKSRKKREMPVVPTDPHEKNKYTTINNKGVANVTVDAVVTSDNETSNDTESDEFEYRRAVVYHETSLILTNLGHFEDYNIEVIACQERDPREKPTENKQCSNQVFTVGRTLPSGTADNINSSLITVKVPKNTTGEVHIFWKDPLSPNGLIITYEIEYKLTKKDLKPNVVCIPHKDYRKKGGYTLDKLSKGNWTFRIRATSLAGNGSWSEEMFFLVADKTEELPISTIVAVSVSGLVLVIILTIIVVWFVAKNRFGKGVPDHVINVSANPDYPLYDVQYEVDDWEVERDCVELLKELGTGAFGMVYEGIVKLNGRDCKVAVKTTNTNASYHERMSFLKEASIMKGFHCYHVVKLMGVVSQGEPAYVIMELMASGDLKHYLRMHRPDDEENNGLQPPSLKEILQMAGEIADGMSYLADKKFVHRDLAARNCMVAEDKTVKIGDFGMTRDIYETDYYRKGGKGLLPVRWMAPESLKDGVFSSMSDVWSFGVVLWEMATLAAQPYQGLSNEEVLRYVGDGKIMDKPEGCPDKLFDLMLRCWSYRHRQRPTFKEIIEELVPELHQSFKMHSYFFSEENKHDSAENFQEEFDDVDDSTMPFITQPQDDSHNLGAAAGEPIELLPPTMYKPHCDFVNYPTERCDMLRETGANNFSSDRNSMCSSPSAIGSSEGSKDSSKSSSSSYALMNGVHVANGHVPLQIRTTPC